MPERFTPRRDRPNGNGLAHSHGTNGNGGTNGKGGNGDGPETEGGRILGMVPVRLCPGEAAAQQLALVLSAVGIPSRLVPLGDGVALCVREADARKAAEELAAYEAENAAQPPSRRATLPERRFVLETVLAYVLTLVAVFAFQRRGAFGLDWTALGLARAGEIREGALWQAVTALTLHGDLGHLLGNLAAGAAFGGLVAATLGAGLGWAAILAAGSLGNLVNAVLLQTPPHASLGASTATFAALGLLAGHRQHAGRHPWRAGLRRAAPVLAGVLLLAFLGFGDAKTDIGAHIAGFGCGTALGFLLAYLPAGRRLDRPGAQRTAGLAAPLVLLAAWLVALA